LSPLALARMASSTETEFFLEAAQSLSKILTENNIDHSFIGGFALRCLGSPRPTQDVDVEIDLTLGDPRDSRAHVIQILAERDPRFSLHHLKVFFTPTCHPEVRFPIEMLPKGQLGLPTNLEVIRLVDGGFIPPYPKKKAMS
jgi:hypothetical protein